MDITSGSIDSAANLSIEYENFKRMYKHVVYNGVLCLLYILKRYVVSLKAR